MKGMKGMKGEAVNNSPRRNVPVQSAGWQVYLCFLAASSLVLSACVAQSLTCTPLCHM